MVSNWMKCRRTRYAQRCAVCEGWIAPRLAGRYREGDVIYSREWDNGKLEFAHLLCGPDPIASAEDYEDV